MFFSDDDEGFELCSVIAKRCLHEPVFNVYNAAGSEDCIMHQTLDDILGMVDDYNEEAADGFLELINMEIGEFVAFWDLRIQRMA